MSDPFETETMAELCAKQGQIGEALAIYRRLVAAATDAATRARHGERLAALEMRTQAPTLTMMPAAAPAEPTLALERRGDALTLRWALPDGTAAPALQVLLVTRGAKGVETETRTLRLTSTRGATVVDAHGVVTVRAAVGRLDGDRFIPLALTS
ncbi:MAG TPA: hypothetical protein VHJ20_16475 [Polyangia bacterium]|nr:hypothetical protein [Polyangia bacterium]